MRLERWHLIENNSHKLWDFVSEKKLREFATANKLIIRRSVTDPYCFYTTSYEYVPAG